MSKQSVLQQLLERIMCSKSSRKSLDSIDVIYAKGVIPFVIYYNKTIYTPRFLGVPPSVYSVGRSCFNGIIFVNNIFLPKNNLCK